MAGVCQAPGTQIDPDASINQSIPLTVAIAGNGMGTVTSNPSGINCGSDCNEQYAPNTVVNLTATAATGSEFAGWMGACTGYDSCAVTIDAAKMVTATFTLTQYPLTVTKGGNGAGVVASNPAGIDCGTTCSESYDYNTSVTLTPTPSAGSTFAGWTGACTGTGACVVTMTSAKTVEATFTLTTHAVSVTTAGNGGGSVTSSPTGVACPGDCSETYNYGTPVTLSATPTTGSVFSGWTAGSCTGTGSCAFNVTGASAHTATFTLTQNLLTINRQGNGGGTVTATGINCGTDCSENVDYGSMVVLTANPTVGTTFAGWSQAGCTGLTCTVTVNSPTTVTATFTLNTYALTVNNAIGNGSGLVASTSVGINCGTDCTQNYNHGEQVTLTATASTGSTFAGWSGACMGTGSCVVPMTMAQSVGANFTLNTYALTVSKTGNGTVTANVGQLDCGTDCNETYNYNQSVTLTATGDLGWNFTGWTGACSGMSTCVVAITNATNVTANFAIIQHTASVNVNGQGTVTSSPAGISCPNDCSQAYDYGELVTLTATPNPGRLFTGWSNGPCSGTGTCTLTMTDARSITATFEIGTTALVVSTTGNGTGTVTSSPTGIDCGADCNEDFANDTIVTLTPAAGLGSVFTGWSGGTCTGTGVCQFQIVDGVSYTVTAQFTLSTHALDVTKNGTGLGLVYSDSPSGIHCGVAPDTVDCTENYDYGTTVTLVASPNFGSTFTGWTNGPCTGTGTCTVDITAATQVRATFDLLPYALIVEKGGTGSGTVSSMPAGISCGFDCENDYDYGSMVTLTAIADAGSTFAGWSDSSCGMSPTCVVTVNDATKIGADFTLNTYLVSVTVNRPAGAPSSVASTPLGIACPGDCSQSYDHGTDVTLVATPGTGYVFDGWSGGCAGTGQCLLDVTSNQLVTANFSTAVYALTVGRAGNGTGSVTATGITCGGMTPDCSETYNYNTMVTLTATPGVGSSFTSWSGDCAGASTMCTVTMDKAKSVTATFTLQKFTLSVTKSGTPPGTITSSPAGISCTSGTCSAQFDYNTVVTLTATPGKLSQFSSWSGSCLGSGTCQVTMTDARSVTGTFALVTGNYVFVTSTTNPTSDFNGLVGADAFCQARATAAGLPGTYIAWLSTSTVNAIDRITASGARGWRRLDNKPVADLAGDLINNHMFYPPRLDEFGNDVGFVFMTTGTSPTGTVFPNATTPNTCGDWDSTSTASGYGGNTSFSNTQFGSNWTIGGSCGSAMRLYCFGISYNNGAVTPPALSSAQRRLAFTTTGGFTPSASGIAAADSLCSSEATAAGLPGTYKALLATTTGSAVSRFDTSASALPWARPDHTLLTEKASDLAANPTWLLAAPHSNAANTAWTAGDLGWSGGTALNAVSPTAQDSCNNWTLTTGNGRSGYLGSSYRSYWFGTFSFACTTSRKVVCLQE